MRSANQPLTNWLKTFALSGGLLCVYSTITIADDETPRQEPETYTSHEDHPAPPPAFFRQLDQDGDGKLSSDELNAAAEVLAKLDRNDDGVDLKELMGGRGVDHAVGFRGERPEGPRDGDRPQREGFDGGHRPGPGGPPWMRGDREGDGPQRGRPFAQREKEDRDPPSREHMEKKDAPKKGDDGDDADHKEHQGRPRPSMNRGPGHGGFGPQSGRGGFGGHGFGGRGFGSHNADGHGFGGSRMGGHGRPEVIIIHVYHHGSGQHGRPGHAGFGHRGPMAQHGQMDHDHGDHKGMGPRGFGRGGFGPRGGGEHRGEHMDRPGKPDGDKSHGEKGDKDSKPKEGSRPDKSTEGKKASLDEPFDANLEALISYFSGK